MERATWLERRYGAEIQWRPFDLHPEYPPEGILRSELLRRYGPGVEERTRAMFAEAGLPMAGELTRVPNSRRALIVSELARDRGVHRELHPRLFDAYWGRDLDLADSDVLIAEGTAAGLDAEEILAALESPHYLERIEQYTAAAMELGAGGVPAWLIDERVLVPGAQPHEVFERVLERLGHEPAESRLA